jgi:phage terminase large subunit-like protein
MRDYQSIALQYAQDVISGAIPAARLTRLSCERQLRDLEREDTDDFPYLFCPEMTDSEGIDYRPGVRICAFAERLKHVKGKWKGENIRLEPWQVFFFLVLFGWVHRDTGYRRFRESYAEVCRKNGKSILGAIIGLYMVTADLEGGAEVYSGATTEKQAWEVFRPARLMAKGSTPLQKKYALAIHAQKLSTESDAFFEPLIGDPGDGASPHCAIVDEFHEHKSPKQYDTMATGMGARTQPLLSVITTAGTNLAGPCYEKRAQAVGVLEGNFINEEFFALIYTIDQADEWDNFENWRKANPNIGVSVFEDYLLGRLREAKQTTSKQNIIRCKHLNQWLSANVAWLDIAKWDACGDSKLNEADFKGRSCYGGLDLAAKLDFNAKIKIYVGLDGKRYLFTRFYLPDGTARDPNKTHYLQWVNDGHVVVNPGDTVDFDLIEDELYNDIITGQIDQMGYDPYQCTQMTNHLIDRLLLKKARSEVEKILVEVRPTVLNFSEPMKELEKLIADGNLIHDNNPVMRWMMANVVCHTDAKDNIYPRKESVANKIDGPVAAIMANSRAMHHVEKSNKGNDGSLINIKL